MKAQKHDERIALRLPSEFREKIQELIRQGKFKNLSDVVRAALEQFLQTA
ncbi:MAG: ribbon-helix-helix domain-containing protein [Candidatus Bathyarchaeia archaeon]